MAGRERSPNYPAQGLPETIEMARQLYEAEKRASVPPDSVARALGYGGLNGRSRVKISTLRKYGLIDEANGRMRLSDLAVRILFERSPEDRQDALNTAAMRPEIFRQLMANAGASDRTLVHDLVQRGFSVDGATAAVAAFRETMTVVSVSSVGYDEADAEDEPMIEAQSAATSGSTGPGIIHRRTATDTVDPTADYVWQLQDGVKVAMQLSGGPLTKARLRMMRKYLDVLEEVLPESDATPSAEIASARPLPVEQSRTDAQD